MFIFVDPSSLSVMTSFMIVQHKTMMMMLKLCGGRCLFDRSSLVIFCLTPPPFRDEVIFEQSQHMTMTMMFKLCGGRCEVPTRVNPKVSRQTIHHHTFTHIFLIIIITDIIMIMGGVGCYRAPPRLHFTVTVLIIRHMIIVFGYVPGLQGGIVGYSQASSAQCRASRADFV